MLWENSGESGWRLWLEPFLTALAALALLSLSFGLQLGMAAAAENARKSRCAICTRVEAQYDQ